MITDRKKKPYSPIERNPIGTRPPGRGGAAGPPMYASPISYRENTLSLFWDKQPAFAVTSADFMGIGCTPYNTHMGRTNPDRSDLIDCFGVKWEFVPAVGGSISHGGNPRFEDANDWRDAIKMPDVDSWDWENGCKGEKPNPAFAMNITTTNGFGFERLISLMDFMNAAIAMADEDQYDALYDLVGELHDVAIKVFDKCFTYYPYIDGITLHDDWGSQKDPFFSEEAARQIFLPHMKRLCDFIHSKGRYVELHSCGHTEARVGVFIDAGIDTWQMQTLNDYKKLYEEVGDKICIQIPVDEFGFDCTDEAQAIECARTYVDNFCKPGKPSMVVARNASASSVFNEELYEYSRKHYLNQ